MSGFLSPERLSGPRQEPWGPWGCLLCCYFHILSRFSLEPVHISYHSGRTALAASHLLPFWFISWVNSPVTQLSRPDLLDSCLSLPFHTRMNTPYVRQIVGHFCLKNSAWGFWTPDQCAVPPSVSTWPLYPPGSRGCLFYRPAPLACFCSREWAPRGRGTLSSWHLCTLVLGHWHHFI